MIPSAWIEFGGGFESGWIGGVALIGLASGIALVWHAIVGASPDWVE
jgi:hypothetical protein